MVYQHPQNKFQYKIFLHFWLVYPYYNLICDCATSQCSPYNSALLNLLFRSCHVFSPHICWPSPQEISCKTPLSSTTRRKNWSLPPYAPIVFCKWSTNPHCLPIHTEIYARLQYSNTLGLGDLKVNWFPLKFLPSTPLEFLMKTLFLFLTIYLHVSLVTYFS